MSSLHSFSSRARGGLGLLCGVIAAIAFTAVSLRVDAAPAIAYTNDDYPAALAAARARRVPLLIELWAPSCFACRLMDAEVYTDAKVIEAGKDFVWLRLNVDRPLNAAFSAKHRVSGYPGLLALDPATESKLMLRLGVATAPQIVAQLADLRLAFSRQEKAGLAAADRDYAEGRYAQAAEGYRSALQSASLSGATRARVFEALTMAQRMMESFEGCAAAADAALGQLPAAEPIVGQIALLGLGCALAAPADAGAWRAAAIAALEPVLYRHVKQNVVLFENRGFPYETLVAAREQAGDKEGAQRMRKEWLEAVMQVARDGASARTRAATASLLRWAAPKPEDCAQITPLLERLEAENPDDYLPPRMLATCYAGNQQPQAALAAIKRSLARKQEGSETVGMLRLQARLEQQSGAIDAARQSLQRAIALAQTPGLEPRGGWTLTDLQQDLAKL